MNEPRILAFEVKKMIQRIRDGLAKIVAGVMLVGALSSPVSADLANIQPAYNKAEGHATVRVEGGSSITDRISIYGFADLDATDERPADFENFYSEARAIYALGKGVSLGAEYNGGNGMKDLVRFGLFYVPDLGDGNFTIIKVLPFETSGDKGLQVSAYSSQQVTGKVGAAITADYNADSKTMYLEPEINIRTGDNSALFLQGRSFAPADRTPDMSAVFGLRYSF